MTYRTDSLNTSPQRSFQVLAWKVELPREEGYKECDVDDESSCREPKECEGDGKWKECEGERPNDSTMMVADVLRIFSDGIREESNKCPKLEGQVEESPGCVDSLPSSPAKSENDAKGWRTASQNMVHPKDRLQDFSWRGEVRNSTYTEVNIEMVERDLAKMEEARCVGANVDGG
ncbi:hypothetical protein B0H14DRAFT_2601288 [Mycena olivaceomarginata]|nr:hypothetical protein B0H14DRAFT_2601288 [Mycena olivaceomarginata]